MATLEVHDLDTFYGNIHALQGVSLTVRDGEIVTLIGANGAGKSTTLRTISGILQPRGGQITLDGQRIDSLPPHRIVELGVCQVPEGRRIFSRMTVLENLEMGAFARKDRGQLQAELDRIFELFPRLKERIGQKGGTLSGGEQQMLAIGRALMSRPTLLLLDEPSLGLAPLVVEHIFGVIRELKRTGTTMLLVEQNVHHALDVADRAYVMETGRITLDGPAGELKHNPQIEQSYLGR